LRQARIALVGAVRRLEETMGRFEASDVPLWPTETGEFAEWTPTQQAIAQAVGMTARLTR